VVFVAQAGFTPTPNPTFPTPLSEGPLPGIVSVIDQATNRVTATIPVGINPIGVAFTPDGTKAYVTNAGDATISVIDTRSNTIVSTIERGVPPSGVAIRDTPNGTLAFVTFEDSDVLAIDTSTDTCGGEICECNVDCPPHPCCSIFGSANQPAGVAIALSNDPRNPLGIVTGLNSIFRIDTTTLAVSSPNIPVGVFPAGVALTPDDALIYVVVNQCTEGCAPNGVVQMIDTAGLGASPSPSSTGTPIPVGRIPAGIAIGQTAAGSTAYVANNGGDTVSVFATGVASPDVAEVGVGMAPFAVALTPDGKFAYVSNQGAGTVSVIDTTTNAALPTPIAVGLIPQGIAVGVIGTPAPTGTPTQTATASLTPATPTSPPIP
jgi:YVTN family beta-propeller protein